MYMRILVTFWGRGGVHRGFATLGPHGGRRKSGHRTIKRGQLKKCLHLVWVLAFQHHYGGSLWPRTVVESIMMDGKLIPIPNQDHSFNDAHWRPWLVIGIGCITPNKHLQQMHMLSRSSDTSCATVQCALTRPKECVFRGPCLSTSLNKQVVPLIIFWLAKVCYPSMACRAEISRI